MKILIMLVLSAILLTGCSSRNIISDNNKDTTSVSQIEAVSVINTENNVVSEEQAIGDYDACTIHTDSYHGFDITLIRYVGMDAFNKWTESRNGLAVAHGADDVCASDAIIITFIKDFNISKEEFCTLYYNNTMYYTIIYDPDILYSGDDKKIEEYFRDFDNNNFETIWRGCEYSFKIGLLEGIREKELNSGITPEKVNFRQTSVVECINKSGLSREEVEKKFNDIVANFNSTLNYDFDKIYNEKEALLSINDGIAIDDSVRISK